MIFTMILTFFNQVYVDKHEMDRIRHDDEPRSFSLLGFKPLDSLLDHHQLRSSSFLYPGTQFFGQNTFCVMHAAHRCMACGVVGRQWC